MKMNFRKGGLFLKVPEHQKFEYKSRYYDPEKEELENKKKQIRFQQGYAPETRRGQNLAGRLRQNRVAGYSRRANNQNQRTFLLVGMLAIILFYFFDQISLIFALPVLFFLMIFFIHKAKGG